MFLEKRARSKLIVSFLFAIILAAFLYLVLAAPSAPTELIFGENTTSNYDKEGNFTVNWTSGGGDAEFNYTIFISVDSGNPFTTAKNDSELGYQFSNTTEGNYSFVIQAHNITATEECLPDGEGCANSTINLWMVVDTTSPALEYNSSTGNTPSNATGANRNWIFVNVSATDINNISSYLVFSLHNSSGLVNMTQYSYPASGIQDINWTGLIESTYEFNVSANDSATNSNTTTTRVFYLDTDGPVITLPQYVNGTAKKNTANLTLNISLADVTSANAVGSHCLIDVNGTGNQTVTASGGWCNSSSISLTGTSDGNSTLNIWVNNSANIYNLSNSFVVQVDTTAPSSSPSCSPSSISLGDGFPCSCGGSDATSGVATTSGSSSSPDGTSMPSSTGAFTYTCGVTDNAGNSASAETTYTVGQNPGSGSSSSGGGSVATTFWTRGTYSISEEQFKQGHSMEVLERQRVKIKIAESDHYVGIKELTQTTAKIEVTSAPQEKILSVGEIWKIDVNDDDYFDLSVKVISISENKASIFVNSISEIIPKEEEAPVQEIEQEESGLRVTGEVVEEEEIEEGDSWLWILVIVLVLIILAFLSLKDRIKSICKF